MSEINKKDNIQTRSAQTQEIDLLEIFFLLLHKAWILILSGLIVGALAFGYSEFMITPLYQASARMYVNNSTISVGSTKLSISSSDITAAQDLVSTYVVIMTSRPTIEKVIEEADLSYDYEELVGMIDAAAINSTEIFEITVTDADPKEAALIANKLAEILPDEIASIVDGCSARIVQSAVVPTKQSSPDVAKNTAIGALIGIVLAAAIIIVRSLMDDMIEIEDDIKEVTDLPVFAVIPELSTARRRHGSESRKEEKDGE